MTENYEIHLKWRECDIRVGRIKQGGFWTGGSYEDKKKKEEVGQSGGAFKTRREGVQRGRKGYELIGEHIRGGVRDAKRENCVWWSFELTQRNKCVKQLNLLDLNGGAGQQQQLRGEGGEL